MGGGVSLLIFDEFTLCELIEYSMLTEHIECLFAKITNNEFTCIIGIAYRPPNSNISHFIDTIGDILGKTSYLPCYLLGDYNIDLLKHDSHIQTERFLDIMYSNYLVPLSCKPTRETETTATLIDNVFTNNYNVNDQFLQGILTTDISDHYIIFHVWDKICPSNDQFQLVRLTNDKRMGAYKRSISDTDWSILDQYENCESYFKRLMDMYKTLYGQSFPVVKVKRKYRNRFPWLTVGLKESIKKKNKLYKISMKHPTAHNVTVYKNYRNMHHSLLTLEEKKYYQSMVIANKHNLRKIWMIIKQVINQSKSTKSAGEFIYNDKTTNDRSITANAFNNFFVNIGPTLASKIPVMGDQFKSYMPATNDLFNVCNTCLRTRNEEAHYATEWWCPW